MSQADHPVLIFTSSLNFRQIKATGEQKGIVAAWEKPGALALKKVQSRNDNYIPDIKQELDHLIRIYTEEPSRLRNKVAHGQWRIALNEIRRKT